MNGKLALALILTLQVSLSLCEIPEPDAELVAKYEAMKTTFYNRLLNAYHKVVEHANAAGAPVAEKLGENAHVQTAKAYVEELQAYPQTQTAVKTITDLAGDAVPYVEKVQTAGLGIYGHYLRPHVGESLDSAIIKIKEYLNLYLPEN